MLRTDTADYRQIFLNDLPLLDVRAPVEFEQGTFPTALNLPLMDDSERTAVGICYKQHGQQAAIELGHSLVCGDIKQQRLAAWQAFCQQNPNGYIYCFRGGIRSHLVQQWLHESGIDYPLIEGGYKALRNYLLQVNQQAATVPMMIIGGNTGCGKTHLVSEFAQGIDLEGIAKHRGSSFGRTLVEQSSQIDFENRLAIQLLKKQHAGVQCWLLEDEGRIIGSNHLPPEIYQAMTLAPVAVVDDPFDVRLARLQQEYIVHMRAGFEQLHGAEAGWQLYCEYLQQGMFAIRKRLGNERYQQLSALLTQSLSQQQASNSSDPHQAWLVPLLKEYYDPMYTYQLSKKAERIIFRGDYQQVGQFLKAAMFTDNHSDRQR